MTAPKGWAFDVFVEFPVNIGGVLVARVSSTEAAKRVARRFGHAVTFWKMVTL